MYFRIPLEQGLRQDWAAAGAAITKYFRIPLEQGLRQNNYQ